MPTTAPAWPAAALTEAENPRDRWRTPEGVWRCPLALLGRLAYDLDAATEDGQKTPPHVSGITREDNALTSAWGSHITSMDWLNIRENDGLDRCPLVWLNPPFSRDGGGKSAWAARAIKQSGDYDSICAFYAPVYGDAYADMLDTACISRISIHGGRVKHLPPPGVASTSPQQHAHAIWMLGPRWLNDLNPWGRLLAWNWRAMAWEPNRGPRNA